MCLLFGGVIDNYFDEAYPSVFAKVMQPVMDAMGYELIVRNQAIGNNPCYAYDACISTHMGDDLDILTWEQSMNCGHNCRPLDTFTRSAYFMEKKVINHSTYFCRYICCCCEMSVTLVFC